MSASMPPTVQRMTLAHRSRNTQPVHLPSIETGIVKVLPSVPDPF